MHMFLECRILQVRSSSLPYTSSVLVCTSPELSRVCRVFSPVVEVHCLRICGSVRTTVFFSASPFILPLEENHVTSGLASHWLTDSHTVVRRSHWSMKHVESSNQNFTRSWLDLHPEFDSGASGDTQWTKITSSCLAPFPLADSKFNDFIGARSTTNQPIRPCFYLGWTSMQCV